MPTPPQPASAEDLYFQGLDLLAMGEAEEAAAVLRRCLDLDPGMLDAMHGLIRALGEAGRLDEAIATAQELARADPDEALAHTSLSILYQRKGMVAEAEAEGLRAKLLDWKRQLAQGKPKVETSVGSLIPR